MSSILKTAVNLDNHSRYVYYSLKFGDFMKKINIYTVLLYFAVTTCMAGDWKYFRGSDTSGIAKDAKPPITWSETENINWKTPIPGRGYSSPVIMDNHIYLTTALEENVSQSNYINNVCFYAESITLKAICIDLSSGSIKWETELFKVSNPTPVHTLNSFATPTPSVDEKNLYCDFGEYGTACVNAKTGAIVWRKKLPVEHQVGPGSSTILYKDLLILLRDGSDIRYITALKKTTGETAWKTDRPPVTGNKTDFHKAFSSPIIFEADGKTQLFAPCAQWGASYNPDNGKEYWRFNHGSGFSLAAQPSVGNGMVYYCTAFSGNEVVAVKHNGSGDVSTTHLAWKTKEFAPLIPSPVLLKDRIYWVQDTGTFCAANSLTGELIWKKKLPGKYLAAPVIAGNRIFLVNQKGLATVIEPADEYKPVAENVLNDEVWATPAFVGKAIILRGVKNLYMIEE